MKDIITRQAEEKDINDMAMLLNDLFSIEKDFIPDPEKQRSGLQLLLKRNSDVIVAEYKNTVIGMCSVQMLVSTAEGGLSGIVEDLIVKSSFRRKGIGKLLLAEIEEIASRQGITRLQLLADKNNIPAIGFYKSRRWKGTDLICLRRNL